MFLEGLHIPLTTPFQPDGRLNLPKLAANVARYSKSPAAGLLVLGPSGEPTLLSDEETREVLRTAAHAASPEKVLLAGISRDSLRATLDLADCAAKLAYDVILVTVPSIFSSGSHSVANAPTATHASQQSGTTHRRELLLYFQALADRSPLPLLLFSDRAHTLPLDAVVELASHPRILGLLDAVSQPATVEALIQRTAAIHRDVPVTHLFAAVTARMIQAAAASHASASFLSANALSAAPSVAQTATALADESPLSAHAPAGSALRTRNKSVGFQILAGNTPSIYDSLRAGSVGAAPAFAAAAPQVCYEVLAAWKDEDPALAAEKQSRLAAAAHFAEETPGNLKFACDLNGYFGGVPRLPHLPPSGEQRTAIEGLMLPLRN